MDSWRTKKSWFLAIVFGLGILALGANFWQSSGSSPRPQREYFSNNTLSQATSRLKLSNMTSAFEVVNVEPNGRRVRLTLKNNYNKTITAYAISAGDHSHNLHELPDEEVMTPGSTRDQVVSLPPEQKNHITVLAVVFNDRTGDGDGSVVKEINDYRLGKKTQYGHIVPLLNKLLAASDNEFETALQEAKVAIDGLPSGSEQELSHFVIAGLRDAKASILLDLEDLNQVRRSAGNGVVVERMTRIRDRLVRRY
jgi:hypothetical protein